MTARVLGRGSIAGLLALCVAASACGLKTEASDQLKQIAQSGGGAIDPGTGVVDPGTGVVDPGTGTTGGTTGGTSGGTTGGTSGGTTGGTSGGTTGGTSGGTTGGTSGGTTGGTSGGLSGADKTGLTASVIKIGIHAPLTGASPLPEDSFNSGAVMYWKGKKFHGRTVEAHVEDDTYKPSGAIKVCQQMADTDFMVIGGAGTDQIQACGRDTKLQRNHVPYLSAGVTTNGLTSIPNYFAISLTYQEQGPMVVRNAEMQGFLGQKWAIAITDTPNFTDAQQSITGALKAKGIEHRVFKMAKAPSDSEAANMAGELRSYAAPVVYFLGQPTFFLKVVAQTHTQLYHPIWTGVGISMGIGTVVQVACASTSNQYDGRFLSPFPGLDRAPQAFFQAGGQDDIELTLYGLSELLGQLLNKVQGELTRESFINAVAQASVPGGVYPSVAFAPNDHFGGSAAWSLKSNCAKPAYDTVGTAPIRK